MNKINRKNKIIFFCIMAPISLSCSNKSHKNTVVSCVELTPDKYIQRQGSDIENYKENLRYFISTAKKNIDLLKVDYEKNERKKKIPLCKDIYSMILGGERAINDKIESSIYSKYIKIYENKIKNNTNISTSKNKCDNSNFFLDDYLEKIKSEKINGTKGMDVSDKKSYTRKIVNDYVSNREKCSKKDIYNVIYPIIQKSINIKSVKGCEELSKNLSKLGLSIEIDGKYPGNDSSYSEAYQKYQVCLSEKN